MNIGLNFNRLENYYANTLNKEAAAVGSSLDTSMGKSQVNNLDKTEKTDKASGIGKVGAGSQSKEIGEEECETCAERKYQDVSNDCSVSFQTPQHISPQASAAVVRSHEQEHVSHAVAEGKEENKELLSTTVNLHVAFCPECGRAYVSGGTTTTRIREVAENPYNQNDAASKKEAMSGNRIDTVA